MHTLVAVIIVYAAIGLVFYLLLGGPLARQKNLGRAGALRMCIFWPATLCDFDLWMKWGLRPSWYATPDRDPDAPRSDVQHENISTETYNNLVFGADAEGVEEQVDDDDVESFIHAQFGHQSAPLSVPTTISYKRTGVSKTYPAGALFPDAFIADWKAGFFLKA